MKKVALVFVLAVFVPSLVLAWLAVRSLRDQQFLLERQQSLLCQGVADATAKTILEALQGYQQEFIAKVTGLVRDREPLEVARGFDSLLRTNWPLAQVGFVVSPAGDIISPSPYARAETRVFCADNGRFLANRESVEVYLNPKQAFNNAGNFLPVQSLLASPSESSSDNDTRWGSNLGSRQDGGAGQSNALPAGQVQDTSSPPSTLTQNEVNFANKTAALLNRNPETRRVYPQQSVGNYQQTAPQGLLNSPSQVPAAAQSDFNETVAGRNQQQRKITAQPAANALQQVLSPQNELQNVSKIAAAEAEFRQLIGEDEAGALARFVDNKLNVLFWCRPFLSVSPAVVKGKVPAKGPPPPDPQLVFGAQLSLARLVEGLRPLVQPGEPALRSDICVALLDDNARPVALSQPDFHAIWKRPFVATEIGEVLPHWEVAVYLLDPAKLTRSARTTTLTLGLLIAVLVLAIGTGSWLIVSDLNRQLTLARQKTDFVSNVSHELKTPLTSIRMFSELLAEGRVTDAAKQRSYLGIITAETARLTRLINNVLDFARIERGEKKYNFQKCDLANVARETADSYRPHLEANGFSFECELPSSPAFVNGDRDALAQVIVNLLSNAEKYSDHQKQVGLRVATQTTPLPYVEVRILDRGLGVPRGREQRIFEKFYRAHDSLNSGIQGSGLGLTLARQIARAHGGDVVYEARDGGGSCFSLRLPLMPG